MAYPVGESELSDRLAPLWIRIFNDLFYGPSYIARPRELSNFFLLDEKPTVVLVGSTGERSGDAQEVPCGAAIEKTENGKSLLFLAKRGESNLFLALKR